jgi:type I restriction enzyme, S subunit
MVMLARITERGRAAVGPCVPNGYKQTDVGVIPEDWDVQSMAELFTFQNGVNADKSAYGSGIPFINVLEVITYSTLTEDRIPGRVSLPAQAKSTFAVQRGDVLFNRTSETQEEVGLTSVYEGCSPVVFGGFVIRASPRDSRMIPAFAAYALRSPSIRAQIVARGQGAIRANIGQHDLSRVQVYLPSKAEQEAIARVLSDADALIESLQQLIAKKRQIKQGTMEELLTGRRRLSGYRDKWDVKPLGDLFTFSGGFSASRDQLGANGHCYLHYGDIHTSNKTFIDLRSEYQDIPKLDVPLNRIARSSLVDDGDVVFVDASEDLPGTSRHVVIINEEHLPFISGLHTIVAKSKTKELDHAYRRYCFQTKAVRDQFYFFAVGTKVSGISKTNIAKVNLPVPSLPEQAAIAAILSDMDSDITVLEQKVAKARQIKQGMTQELLTGRIRLI